MSFDMSRPYPKCMLCYKVLHAIPANGMRVAVMEHEQNYLIVAHNEGRYWIWNDNSSIGVSPGWNSYSYEENGLKPCYWNRGSGKLIKALENSRLEESIGTDTRGFVKGIRNILL